MKEKVMILSLFICLFSKANIVHSYQSKATTSPDSKPNIVIIYSDDQGWGDVGYHGYNDVYTPNIDKLAKQGTQFSQAYVSASVCGPSRAGLISGVHQQKFGFYGNGENTHIPTSQPTIFERVKAHGYTTGAVGKWHIGDDEGHPLKRGTDFYYGFLNGAHDYYKSSNEPQAKKSLAPIYRNYEKEPPIQESNGYLTEMFTNEAVSFIDRSADKPFLLYLAYNAVHHPWDVPQKYLERLKHLKTDKERKLFAGMLLAMDDGVGAVLQSLKRNGVDENTLVFFMSDNGSPRGQGLVPPKKKKRGQTVMSSPGPFNGFKGDTYEGGIRVPFVMRWPNKIPENQTYAQPVLNLDIVKTTLAAIGMKESKKGLPLDGIDLLPYITNKNKADLTRVMYWRRDEDYAIRDGKWKLTFNDESGPKTIQLFDLENDIEEFHDLSRQFPKIAQQLQNKFDQWDSSLPDNAFGKTANNRNSGYPEGNIKNVIKFNDIQSKQPAVEPKNKKKKKKRKKKKKKKKKNTS
ncbi:sulfatase-like hydrolase/transferase [Thalassotalea fonticola]|uniref:Sulfatase-like hydrolase/transferase n=1 Tax=Thalassotalea fonticola TaxID=3065649 RepID=A0ABZ0GSN1_9GAMM|nr:sulfatase-like hydrolase/transferase [Colwelliaceae bacterium S1-1]